MEELRFPSLRSPDHDTFPTTGPQRSRPESGFFSSNGNDARASLQRRFTTDASKMSLARPFGNQYGNMQPGVRASHQPTVISNVWDM